MKRAFLNLVLLTGFVSGIAIVSSSEIVNGSETLQKVRAEISELEQKQLEYPFDADLQFILGTNYWTLNNDNKAIEHYQRVLVLDPEYYAAHWNLSSIYHRKENGENAIRHMKKAEAIFLKLDDPASLTRARDMLKGYYAKYDFKPEDFEPKRGWLERIIKWLES